MRHEYLTERIKYLFLEINYSHSWSFFELGAENLPPEAEFIYRQIWLAAIVRI